MAKKDKDKIKELGDQKLVAEIEKLQKELDKYKKKAAKKAAAE